MYIIPLVRYSYCNNETKMISVIIFIKLVIMQDNKITKEESSCIFALFRQYLRSEPLAIYKYMYICIYKRKGK